jgi:hypothetical protein
MGDNMSNNESIATDLITRFPSGYLVGEIEVGWPCRMALRAKVRGLDSPVVALEGSYQELREFERVYKQIKEA